MTIFSFSNLDRYCGITFYLVLILYLICFKWYWWAKISSRNQIMFQVRVSHNDERKYLNYIIDQCQPGDHTFRQTGLLSGECYFHILKDTTFTEAVETCAKNNCELPVPTSPADNQFIGSIGSTFLGIQGALDDGVVTWNNIYTKVWLNFYYYP